MKREFLLSLQVEGKNLPKEVIDAIMAENGKDIQRVKAGFADYEQVRQALAQAQEKLDSQDFEGALQAARQWEEKYNQAVESHQQALDALRFDHLLENAISVAKGRNAKAITALLDVESLKNSEDPGKAVSDAVAQLKKENAYLFEAEQTPPPYARGTGSQQGTQESAPATLAEALKEKFYNK